jgi:hypothetical protein
VKTNLKILFTPKTIRFLVVCLFVSCSTPELNDDRQQNLTLENEPKDSHSGSNTEIQNLLGKGKDVSVATSSTENTIPSEVKIQPPEDEISEARSALANIALKLQAAKRINAEKKLTLDEIRSQEILAQAEMLASKKHWLATIRELNLYLNMMQVPEKKKYLRSHYLLGQAYEGLRSKPKAARAYLRYVAAAINAESDDAPDLPMVLERLIYVASTNTQNDADLSPLLASLASSDLPQEVRPRVLFYVGRSAFNHGKPEMATRWLEEAFRTSQDPVLRNKIAYIQGLMHLSRNEWDNAEEIFQRVSRTEVDPEYRDLSRLALARVAVHRRKPDQALSFYELVPESSPLYEEATFESIYLHIGRREFGEARSKAVYFLGRFPESREGLQVRLLLAYLDMRAGDLDTSEQSIKTADQHLADITNWIKTRLAGRTAVGHRLLLDFVALSKESIAPTPTIKESTVLFERIAESARRLADIHGEIQNIYYALARAELDTIRPIWRERALQLKTLAEEALTVGHKLAAADRILSKNHLTPLAWQKLTASEKRRTLISKSPAIKIPDYQRHNDISRFLHLANMTADAYQKFRQSEADLAGTTQLVIRQGPGSVLTQSRIKELEDRRKRLTQNIETTLRKLRQSKIEILIAQSPFQGTRRFISQYSAALQEESSLLEEFRDSSTSTPQRLTAEDASLAWAAWEGVMKELFTQLDGLESEVKKGLTDIFANLESYEARYSDLSGRIKGLNDELEQTIGSAIPYLVDQYSNIIQERFAKHRKWRADIEWLRYQKIVENDEKITRKLNLEEQILKDNLLDLQQGVKRKWAE